MKYPQGKRWLIWVSAGGAALLLSGVIAFFLYRQDDSVVVATVNGNPIYRQEFEQHMVYYHRAQAIDYFGKSQQNSSIPAMKTSESQDSYAKRLTLETCVAIKVQQAALRDKGIIEEIDYPTFLQEWKQENERRKKAVAEGRIIYGPQEYDVSEYFAYSFSNQVQSLKEAMAGQELPMADEKLRQFYESVKQIYFRRPSDIQAEWVTFSSENSTHLLWKALESKLNKGIGWDELISGYGLEPIRKGHFDESTARSDSRYREPLKLAVMQLAAGEIALVDSEDGFLLVRCTEIQDRGCYPFFEVEEQVRTLYLNQLYHTWLEEQCAQANVVLNEDIYAQITLEGKE